MPAPPHLTELKEALDSLRLANDRHTEPGKPLMDQEVQAAASSLAGARHWNGIGDVPARRLILALVTMSDIRVRQGDLVRAESLLNEGRRVYEDFPQLERVLAARVHLGLARLQVISNRDAEALDNYQLANSLLGQENLADSDLAPLHAAMGECCRRLGDNVHADHFTALSNESNSLETVNIRGEFMRIYTSRNFSQPNHAGVECSWEVVWHRRGDMFDQAGVMLKAQVE